jgi:uncharacterized low-complexity protein
MNQKNLKTLALGAAIAGSLAAVPVAQANPFSLTSLGSAYMAADGDTKGTEGKCGGDKAKAEGKCGGEKAKDAEGKCGEGKCGAKMKDGEHKEGEKAKQPEKA